MEDALKRLDKLTHEEARMATAQVLKTMTAVDKGVRGVADRVVGVDDRVARVEDGVTSVNDRVVSVDERVAGIDNRLAGVDDRVGGVDNRVKRVDDRVAEVGHGTQPILWSAKICLNLINLDAREGRERIDQVQRVSSPTLVGSNYGILRILSENQLRENIHKWLCPPDPSTNHNVACLTHHKRTATWFFQGSIFKEWVSMGSLLWIHGKRASFHFPPNII